MAALGKPGSSKGCVGDWEDVSVICRQIVGWWLAGTWIIYWSLSMTTIPSFGCFTILACGFLPGLVSLERIFNFCKRGRCGD